MKDVELKKVGETIEDNKLPKGVTAVIVNSKLLFIRTFMGQIVPVSPSEQAELSAKHRIE